jgi:TonB family protein
MSSIKKNNNKNRTYCSLVIIFIFFNLSFAQTEIISGKNISGNVKWYGTKIIRGDVIVLPSARLVITPGTKVIFSANTDLQKSGNDKTKSELIVKGVLIAQGQYDNKIIFTSEAKSPRMGDWYGIIFQKVTEQSIVDYCIIEYAYEGITIKKSKVQVSNCEIRYNYHAGLSIEVKSNPKISRNIISENDYAGIICTLGSYPILSDNLITLNGMGIVILSSSQPNLGRLQKGDSYNPGKNRIMQNEEYDIYNHSNKEIFAENNLWSSARLNDIAANLFDNRDDSKYGIIDFNPLYKEEPSTKEVDDLLLLAQNQQNNNETLLSQENLSNPTSSAVNKKTEVKPETSKTENIAQNSTFADQNQNLNKIETPDINKLQAKPIEPPIIASAKPESGISTNEQVANNETATQIDYNNIFLEAFLDGGKKEYITKEKVQINEIIRRTMQSGIVRIQVIVGKNGRVESAKVLKGFNDVLDEAALKTAKSFRYKPATINRMPVRFRTIEVFVFSTGSG